MRFNDIRCPISAGDKDGGGAGLGSDNLCCTKVNEETYPMTTPEKPKGPASYFPSIEKKYGQPIAQWLDLLKLCCGLKHMEMVARLKTLHSMGHGHANAIVACWMAAKK